VQETEREGVAVFEVRGPKQPARPAAQGTG
jgi:hypothetical protein